MSPVPPATSRMRRPGGGWVEDEGDVEDEEDDVEDEEGGVEVGA